MPKDILNEMKSIILFAKTVFQGGTSIIVLYCAFCILIILFVISLFSPTYFGHHTLDSAANMLTLLFLAELFYLKLKDKDQISNALEGSGIKMSTSHLMNQQLEELMSTPGKIIVLNAWIPNFSDLTHYLERALENKKTIIELNIINPESAYAQVRGEELGMTKDQVKHAVDTTITDINRFYLNIDGEKQSRVHLYFSVYLPKISIYACNYKALVGFCWPKKFSIETSYFFIEGQDGHFTKTVWDYYNQLNRTEITNQLGSK